MEPLQIEPTKKTPFVYINADAGVMEMKGMSSSENSLTFYKPILDYLDNCISKSMPINSVELFFKYFNTSSAKCILDVLERFADMKDKGMDVNINWYCEPMDEEMLDSGQNFSTILDLPINIVEKTD